MRRRQDLSNKMCRRPDLLTKSSWVLCPVNALCNLFERITAQNLLLLIINSLINESINLWPAYSTSVFPTGRASCALVCFKLPLSRKKERRGKNIVIQVYEEITMMSQRWRSVSPTWTIACCCTPALSRLPVRLFMYWDTPAVHPGSQTAPQVQSRCHTHLSQCCLFVHAVLSVRSLSPGHFPFSELVCDLLSHCDSVKAVVLGRFTQKRIQAARRASCFTIWMCSAWRTPWGCARWGGTITLRSFCC